MRADHRHLYAYDGDIGTIDVQGGPPVFPVTFTDLALHHGGDRMSRSHGGWLRHGADTALQKRHMAATSAFKHVVVGLSKSPLTKPDDAPLRRYWEYLYDFDMSREPA